MASSYMVLARRTRPQSFSDLIGQEAVSKSISNMLSRQQVPHAFLFTGTRGTGKTSSARILAKTLCCEHGPTVSPCQTCTHCVQITACAHPDVLEIDGASNTGVDHVRELKEAARFYPTSARYKVFIIDEVHMLSTGAFNALLKTLEEPPRQVIFIFATTELNKVPLTVRSRCMIFSFKKIDVEIIAQNLKKILAGESISFDEDAIKLIAREAKGSIRDSLSLLEQVISACPNKHISLEETKNGLCIQNEEFGRLLFQAICEKNIAQGLQVLKDADALNLDFGFLMEATAGLVRAAMVIKGLNHRERAIVTLQLLDAEYDEIEKSAAPLTTAALSEIFRLLSGVSKELSKSSIPLAWAEMTMIDCISRAEWLSAQELMGLLSGATIAQKPQAVAAPRMAMPAVKETPAAVTMQPKLTRTNVAQNFQKYAKVPAAVAASVAANAVATEQQTRAKTDELLTHEGAPLLKKLATEMVILPTE